MSQNHLPRSLIILLFFLVAVTFFVGTLRTFAPAHAAIVLENLAQKADLPSADKIIPTSTSIADFPSLGPTPTPSPTSFLPPPTGDAIFMPTPPPTFTPMATPPTSFLPPPTGDAIFNPTPPPTFTPMATPIPEQGYADTTGIIALAILLVVVILVGLAWGGRRPRI